MFSRRPRCGHSTACAASDDEDFFRRNGLTDAGLSVDWNCEMPSSVEESLLLLFPSSPFSAEVEDNDVRHSAIRRAFAVSILNAAFSVLDLFAGKGSSFSGFDVFSKRSSQEECDRTSSRCSILLIETSFLELDKSPLLDVLQALVEKDSGVGHQDKMPKQHDVNSVRPSQQL